SPDADPLGINAGFGLDVRDGRAKIFGLAEVVQVRPLDLDARVLLPHSAFVGGRVRFEQQYVAAAVAVRAIVNRHRHQTALRETRRVLLDADRLGVDAVPDHDHGPFATRAESFRKKDSAITRRPVAVERDLPGLDALWQGEKPVRGLRAAFALHL